MIILALPDIVRNPSDQNGNIYSSIMLTCQIQGVPMPNITWLKDDNEIVDTSKYSVNLLGFSVLTLNNVTLSDEGKYKCKGENPAGITYSSDATVYVYRKLCGHYDNDKSD